ncbi:helix-turn-helix domain-containing protein [Microvirga arsenatis]|uniref:Helix-turn-helix domain-containing protein n=1 Tax=Microvirga arsenatis TaxID=2692265 RepID=A0ABW9YUT8_9HYPH|nr:helix-turn-helix domain-containing protein [Microvirga arsenatis]NBJ10945.1 helix-turn-helix domain-containing protein [Microvirga arsenatis]NBJ24158.1 helix-turn-helix domain-containing protein [Microvirga arsenatis]
MADSLKLALGLRVQAARRRARLTQEALAEKVGRTPESISNIERGLQLPTIETLADLARVLSVPLPELVEGIAERKIAPERLQIELQLRETTRILSDTDLKIALELVQVLARAKGRTRLKAGTTR